MNFNMPRGPFGGGEKGNDIEFENQLKTVQTLFNGRLFAMKALADKGFYGDANEKVKNSANDLFWSFFWAGLKLAEKGAKITSVHSTIERKTFLKELDIFLKETQEYGKEADKKLTADDLEAVINSAKKKSDGEENGLAA